MNSFWGVRTSKARFETMTQRQTQMGELGWPRVEEEKEDVLH
jgi:hypothetical protein